MNMVDLMWLFCGAFVGGLVTLFFSAMLNISHEKTELEHARRKIEKLEEDKRALKIALESPTSPDKGGYTDMVKLLEKAGKINGSALYVATNMTEAMRNARFADAPLRLSLRS